VKNNEELPMYLVDNSHEAIIKPEIFEMVQKKKQTGKQEMGWSR